MVARFLAAVLMSGLLAAFVSPLRAQADPSTCTALASSALAAFDQSCSNLEGDTACYGNSGLEAAFTDDAYAVLFTRPGDRPPIGIFTSIHALRPDPASFQWGIGLMSLNLPELPGAAAHLLLLGDARVENVPASLSPEQPMRTFSFRAGSESSPCAETPSALVVQTPHDSGVMFTINGASMQVASLVVFQWLSQNSLAAMVYSGTLQIIGGKTASAGQTLLAVTDNDGQVVFWSAPRASTVEEVDAAKIAAGALSGVGVPIAAAVVIPPSPTPQPTTIPQPSPACGSSVTHTVQPGENLFRIAQRYGTSINAIASANGLANPNQIVVGQTLVIPCGVDSGSSSAPPPSNNSPAASPSSGDQTSVDCSILSDPVAASVPPDLLNWLRQACSG